MFKVFNEIAEISNETKNEVASEMYELCDKYDHNPTEYGIRCIMDEWLSNKGALINALRTSKYWDEKNLRLVIPCTFKRNVNDEACKDFARWATRTAKELYKKYQPKIGLFTLGEYYDYRAAVYNKVRSLQNICDYSHSSSQEYKIIHSMYKEVNAELERINDNLLQFTQKNGIDKYSWCLPEKRYEELVAFTNAMETIGYVRDQFVSESIASHEYIKKYCEMMNISVVEGNKVSRFVQKMCKAIGLDKVVDIREVEWTGQDGIHHEKMSDRGWNYQYAQYCDAINPKEMKKDLYISLNPLDYLTSSWFVSTASCHDFSRGKHLEEIGHSSNNDYSGCYCSGTISYMLDGTTVVAYWKADEDKYDKWTKEKRCLFMIGEDKIIQSRLYPDGRDGEDENFESLATQWRNVVQNTVAEIFDVPNLWVLKKGTCGSYVCSYGTHYRDYTSYSDCSCSILKGTDNEERIYIGHNPICVTCGEEHTSEKDLSCCDCIKCEHCGSVVNDYDATYATNRYGEEVVFCDSYCAENEGYVNAYDGDCYVWREECDCFEDCDGNWYLREAYEDSMVETEDGTVFATAEDALSNGYDICYDDYCWYSDEELCRTFDDDELHLIGDCYYDDYKGEYFYDESEMIEIDGLHFYSEENAIAYGCVYNDEIEEWEVA